MTTSAEHLVRIDTELDRFVEVAAGGLDRDVPTCPGWSVAKLAQHLARVYGFVAATHEVGSADAPVKVAAPAIDDSILRVLRDAGDRVIDRLRTGGDDHPVWSWTEQRDGAFWARRLAYETIVHRIDVELALGVPSRPVEPAVAADGIDEWFTTYVIAHNTPASLERPGSSVHVHCTDTDGEWMLRIGDDAAEVTREHAKGDVAARGTADALLRALTGRGAVDEIEVLGDAELLDALIDAGF